MQAADFYLSDEAFARERLTSSPVFLTRLSADLLDERWPSLKADIVGLDELLQGQGGDFDDLLKQGKVRRWLCRHLFSAGRSLLSSLVIPPPPPMP